MGAPWNESVDEEIMNGKRMKRISHCLLFSLAAALCACIYSHPRYPKTWPPQSKEAFSEIASLVGTYECTGDTRSGYANGLKANISDFVLLESSRPKVCDYFKIESPKDNVLAFSIIKAGTPVASRVLESPRDFKFKGGVLR